MEKMSIQSRATSPRSRKGNATTITARLLCNNGNNSNNGSKDASISTSNVGTTTATATPEMAPSKRQKTGKDKFITPPSSSSPPPRSSPPSSSPSSGHTSTSPDTSADQVAQIHASLVNDLGIANPSPELAERINTDARTIEAAIALVTFSREAREHPERLTTNDAARSGSPITLRKRMRTAEGIKAVTASRKRAMKITPTGAICLGRRNEVGGRSDTR
ncbi:hypothetical protein E4U42_007579 [Claviceps africana]|uniref:Uncharacterized protein n=1 Tax=Claviceps africana TaxID=83212 RepID=A0A8K0J6M0_9HYPO|nr:hypothetical protein E4U42_007579 [Claviceps africana]